MFKNILVFMDGFECLDKVIVMVIDYVKNSGVSIVGILVVEFYFFLLLVESLMVIDFVLYEENVKILVNQYIRKIVDVVVVVGVFC